MRSGAEFYKWTVLALACCCIVPLPAAMGQESAGSQYFENHIRPLLAEHCYECHSAKSGESQGGLELDHSKGWLSTGSQGPIVDPGKPDNSLLLKAVRYDPTCGLEMPPDGRLRDSQIELIFRWITIGAPGPAFEAPVHKSDSSLAPWDPKGATSHWAFKEWSERQYPELYDADWSGSPIDAWIRQDLKNTGMEPSPPAEPAVLVRRFFFVLTGLPPSPQELKRWVEDDEDLRWQRLVDQLLSSPRFGERWGRHWLDLARYADSNGLDENFLYREAWRYRNWVIDAVDCDMPYDRFLTEQIAGDQLPHETIEERDSQRLATGFLLIGPKVLLGIEEERQRMDVADELLDTIGRAVLGQTIGCARCHNHKFDPIPTADYYAMAGVFASTQVMERRYMLGQQRVMEQLLGLGEKGQILDDEYEAYWRGRAELKTRKDRAAEFLEVLKQGGEEVRQLVDSSMHAFSTTVARDLSSTIEQRIASQASLVAELQKRWAQPPAIPPRGMIAVDKPKPSDEAIRVAGKFNQRASVVPRGFLTALSSPALATDLPDGQSGRMQLAQWLTDTDQRSGRLAARVYANRIWFRLMGRGLVSTVDNFGRTGQEPSHPELLDYLARRLIRDGWSTKKLIREIVLTQTFAQSSKRTLRNEEIDPENHWYWRAFVRRLDPEALRDAILASSGELDLGRVDSTVAYLGDQATAVGANKVRRRTDFPNRSVFLPVIRNDLPELFEAFDFADPHIATGARPQTLVPSQALFLMNDEAVIASAGKLVDRLGALEDDQLLDEQIGALAQLTGVSLDDEARQAMHQFAGQVESSGATRAAALKQLAHALFCSSQFQFID